jgi:hypothetical protein
MSAILKLLHAMLLAPFPGGGFGCLPDSPLYANGVNDLGYEPKDHDQADEK